MTDNDFIPYLGAVYAFNDDINVFASYTETFQAQNELDINNQQLAPVVGESREIGVKSSLFEGKAVASLSYFDVQQTNLAIADPNTANLPPTEQRFIGSVGIGSHGFELDLAGEILPGLNTSLGITDFSISGNQLVANYTPSTMVKFGAVYDVTNIAGLSVGLNLRWQDDISREQGVVGIDFANAGDAIVTKQAAYAVADLLVKYEINSSISVNFNLFNLTDEKYLTSLYWAQSYYAAPRTVSATLSWSL